MSGRVISARLLCVVGLADENGSKTAVQYTYDAFGRLLHDAPDPFGYCGEYYDSESGNVYLRNRYYSPDTGRFISEDPVQDGLNWYAYCAGDPVNLYTPRDYVVGSVNYLTPEW